LELQDFSYIVSHDLAATFRHVSEFSRLLVGEFGEDLTGSQAAYAARVSTATAKGQTMMDALLVYSRVQQKQMEIEARDATAMMQAALSTLTPEVQASGASVSIDPLGAICGDPHLLAIAFQALLSNAIKFHRPGAQPQISVRSVTDDAFWRLRVTDDGIGIEPAYREKVFRMFHRLNGEDAYPGVGAGLTIGRRIARRHGGEISFLDGAEGACVELSLARAMVVQ
jgi:light-regulated signal transduction histidine kinase (bacteriophytochrome)